MLRATHALQQAPDQWLPQSRHLQCQALRQMPASYAIYLSPSLSDFSPSFYILKTPNLVAPAATSLRPVMAALSPKPR